MEFDFVDHKWVKKRHNMRYLVIKENDVYGWLHSVWIQKLSHNRMRICSYKYKSFVFHGTMKSAMTLAESMCFGELPPPKLWMANG